MQESFTGLVLFAQGSDSSRQRPRNCQVALRWQEEGIVTLLTGLLTDEEDQVDGITRQHRANNPLPTRRIKNTTVWVAAKPTQLRTPIGFLGGSTGGHLQSDRQLAIVPDTGHLFEESGVFEAVQALAADWFSQHPTAKECIT